MRTTGSSASAAAPAGPRLNKASEMTPEMRSMSNRVLLTAVCFALAMFVAATNVSAQTDEEFDKIYPFIGNWDGQVGSPNEQDRGNCGGRLGDYGEKILNCSMPVDQLPLNLRAEAWLRYMDARQSP